ncbi:hypothetical protein, partial [Halomonas citrativorans]|uniref:hypothetical protein n=1 Tax=Halomonas citrativorans TaxID=2742612 RepID=UPI001CE40CBA
RLSRVPQARSSPALPRATIAMLMWRGSTVGRGIVMVRGDSRCDRNRSAYMDSSSLASTKGHGNPPEK